MEINAFGNFMDDAVTVNAVGDDAHIDVTIGVEQARHFWGELGNLLDSMEKQRSDRGGA